MTQTVETKPITVAAMEMQDCFAVRFTSEEVAEVYGFDREALHHALWCDGEISDYPSAFKLIDSIGYPETWFGIDRRGLEEMSEYADYMGHAMEFATDIVTPQTAGHVLI